MSLRNKIIVVGGGLSGLSCAVHLHSAGAQPLVLESSDSVGGRVRTDLVEGYQLDRGFQVYLTAYPEAAKILDLKALDLRRFRPGALVFKNGKLHRVMDAFRCPQSLLSSVLAPIGTLVDKLLVAKLRFQVGERSMGPDRTTEEFLRNFGFSETMVNDFFRSFYGGIFLERELATSSRMFEFTFRMFRDGYAALPAKGMQEIPNQLAARLPATSIRCNAPVVSAEEHAVVLETGERLEADVVVVATDATTASMLVKGSVIEAPQWRSVTELYFAAPRSPLNEPIIALNGTGVGVVNNVCVLSDVAPEYAPASHALVSVSALGIAASDNIETVVRNELLQWFGVSVNQWRLLRTNTIRKALPSQRTTPIYAGVHRHDGVYICGDHCVSASIEGALVSGLRTAEAILSGVK